MGGLGALYIEVFYDRERRHRTLGQRSPIDYGTAL
jgi:hypothetical protein